MTRQKTGITMVATTSQHHERLVLSAGLCLLIAVICLFTGCGSGPAEPEATAKHQISPDQRNLKVKESFPERARRRPPGRQGRVEVLPPARPGERGLTRAEVEALLSEAPDFYSLEVLPPEKP